MKAIMNNNKKEDKESNKNNNSKENNSKDNSPLVFDSYDNPARIFGEIARYLRSLGERYDIALSELLDKFILDLKNQGDDNYEKQLKDINLVVDTNLIHKFEQYASRMKKSYLKEQNQKEKNLKGQNMEVKWDLLRQEIDSIDVSNGYDEKISAINKLILKVKSENDGYIFQKDEKKYILKKLNDELNATSILKNEKKRVEYAVRKLSEKADDEYKKGKISNKLKYWTEIKNAVINDKNDNKKIKLRDESKQFLEKLLEDKIYEEREENYYEQVKKFTRDFSFLGTYPELQFAQKGRMKINKFTDVDTYNRFNELRNLFKNGDDEYSQIKDILKDKNSKLSDTDKRILAERKVAIEKELEMNR